MPNTEKLLAKAKALEASNDLEKAAKAYEKAAAFSPEFSGKEHCIREAERLAMRISNERAVNVYEHLAAREKRAAEKAVYLLRGARSADKLGLKEKARKLYSKAISLEKKCRNCAMAGKIAEEAGLTEAAARLYAKAGMVDTASSVARKARLKELSIKFYEQAARNALPREKANCLIKAARLAREDGMIEKPRKLCSAAVMALYRAKDRAAIEEMSKETGCEAIAAKCLKRLNRSISSKA